MAPTSRQQTIERLKNELREGNVVVVTGSGVSVAAAEGEPAASWQGLLHDGLDHCRTIGLMEKVPFDLMKAQVETGDTQLLINVAQLICTILRQKSEGTFKGWLKRAIGELKVKNAAVLEALASLPAILTTLNYDTLIEQATGRKPIPWDETDAVQDSLRKLAPSTVLHLHGWYGKPESVVFGWDSYTRVRQDLHASEVLRTFAIRDTMLFVGCGDTFLDPNFACLIDWAAKALESVSPRHLVLCCSSQMDEFRHRLRAAPWIVPLEYGAKHSDLVPFLRSLSDGCEGRSFKSRAEAPTLLSGFDPAGPVAPAQISSSHVVAEASAGSTDTFRGVTSSDGASPTAKSRSKLWHAALLWGAPCIFAFAVGVAAGRYDGSEKRFEIWTVEGTFSETPQGRVQVMFRPPSFVDYPDGSFKVLDVPVPTDMTAPIWPSLEFRLGNQFQLVDLRPDDQKNDLGKDNYYKANFDPERRKISIVPSVDLTRQNPARP
jgi:hypothetical protein